MVGGKEERRWERSTHTCGDIGHLAAAGVDWRRAMVVPNEEGRMRSPSNSFAGRKTAVVERNA